MKTDAMQSPANTESKTQPDSLPDPNAGGLSGPELQRTLQAQHQQTVQSGQQSDKDNQSGPKDNNRPAPKEPDFPEGFEPEEYGLTPEAAKELAQTGQLETVLVAMDRLALQREMQRQQLAAAQAPQQPVSHAQPSVPQSQPQPVKTEPVLDDDLLSFEFSEDEYEEPVVKHAKATKHLAARVKQLESQLHAAVQYIEAEQQRRFVEEIENYFARLPEPWQEIYGKGPYESLPAQQRQARDETVRAAIALGNVYGVRNLTRLLDRGRYAQHGMRIQSIARKELQQQLRDQKTGQFISRPTHREPPPKSGLERAFEKAEELSRRLEEA